MVRRQQVLWVHSKDGQRPSIVEMGVSMRFSQLDQTADRQLTVARLRKLDILSYKIQIRTIFSILKDLIESHDGGRRRK